MGRFLPLILMVAALAAEAGCAASRPQPVLAAATPQSGFGYSDTKLAPDRYEVRYATPVLSLPADEKARAGAVEKKSSVPTIWRYGMPPSWRSPAASASSLSARPIATPSCR
jgi:Uncharacterized protein conserved in bacteria